MSRTHDFLRSFGMSGLLLSQDLLEIERRFGLELGHPPSATSRKSMEYYPQFEQAVRAEAEEMAAHYQLFYCLEKAIRKLISETLQESDGATWWENGRIPGEIVQEVKKIVQREIDNGMTRRSESMVDYTTFGQLSQIITSNWDLFGAIFSSRRAVEKIMTSLNLLRGPIAHCCPLAEDEVLRLQLAVRDWFRMMAAS